jgi:hypothetical protein
MLVSFTPTQNNWQNYGFVHFNLYIPKNILEVNEEKRLQWFGHVKRMPGNRLPWKILEWQPEGMRRK